MSSLTVRVKKRLTQFIKPSALLAVCVMAGVTALVVSVSNGIPSPEHDHASHSHELGAHNDLAYSDQNAPSNIALADDSTSFADHFDGDPANPQPFLSSSRWDISVHSRDPSTWNTTEDSISEHDGMCMPPPTTHVHNTYDSAVFNCKNHVMTSIKAGGYGLIAMTPNHLVDFSAGEAVISFDINTLRTSQRDWWDVWITPFSDQLQLPFDNGAVDLNDWPSRAVQISTTGEGGHCSNIFHNFVQEGHCNYNNGDLFYYDFPGKDQHPEFSPSAVRRDTVEIRISETHLKVWMPQYGFTWIDRDYDTPLDWDQGIVQFAQHSYNPLKDCPVPGTCRENTWHWDNVSINPSVPFTMIHADKRQVGSEAPDPGTSVTFSAPAPANAMLRFSGVNYFPGGNPVDPLEVSYDGGSTWHTAVHPNQQGESFGHASSYWMPIPQGTTTAMFKAENGAIWVARNISIFANPNGNQQSVGTPTPPPVFNANPLCLSTNLSNRINAATHSSVLVTAANSETTLVTAAAQLTSSGNVALLNDSAGNVLNDGEMYAVKIKARGYLSQTMNLQHLRTECKELPTLLAGDVGPEDDQVTPSDLVTAIRAHNGSVNAATTDVYSPSGIPTTNQLVNLIAVYNETK